jgi:hypothetical protein
MDALMPDTVPDLPAQPDTPALRLIEFRDDLARDFHDINAEWITSMFVLEATDREVLENPRAKIIDPGGAILFVEADGRGVVGDGVREREDRRQARLRHRRGRGRGGEGRRRPEVRPARRHLIRNVFREVGPAQAIR